MDQRGIWELPNPVLESKESGSLHDQALDDSSGLTALAKPALHASPLTLCVLTLALPFA